MEHYIRFADRLSAWFGKAFAWCVMVMTLGVGYEVFVRYVLNAPTAWAFDLTYMMYGTMFMMAGAYTLSRDGHVRGDFVYRLWKPATQAKVELVLYFFFFFPGVLADFGISRTEAFSEHQHNVAARDAREDEARVARAGRLEIGHGIARPPALPAMGVHQDVLRQDVNDGSISRNRQLCHRQRGPERHGLDGTGTRSPWALPPVRFRAVAVEELLGGKGRKALSPTPPIP